MSFFAKTLSLKRIEVNPPKFSQRVLLYSEKSENLQYEPEIGALIKVEVVDDVIWYTFKMDRKSYSGDDMMLSNFTYWTELPIFKERTRKK